MVLLISLVGFVAYTLYSTGFFRSIQPAFEGEILKEIALNGAEDIMISREDSFVLISSTNRQIYPPQEEETGGLYLIDLSKGNDSLIHLTADFDQSFAPHGISCIRKDSGYQVMAISHTNAGHAIEVFELYEQELTHLRTMRHPSLVSPNDLVLVAEDEFYVTNDHRYEKGIGRLAEDYAGWALSTVVYYADGEYRKVADGIAYANGINFDPKRNLMYVASARGFLVNVYSRETDGSLTFIEDIDCKTGVDNIEFGEDGSLWIGAHPNLLRFNAYSKGKAATAPSEIIRVRYDQKGSYMVDKIFIGTGERISGCSVAAVFGDLIFVGNVMDKRMLVLRWDGQSSCCLEDQGE